MALQGEEIDNLQQQIAELNPSDSIDRNNSNLWSLSTNGVIMWMLLIGLFEVVAVQSRRRTKEGGRSVGAGRS